MDTQVRHFLRRQPFVEASSAPTPGQNTSTRKRKVKRPRGYEEDEDDILEDLRSKMASPISREENEKENEKETLRREIEDSKKSGDKHPSQKSPKRDTERTQEERVRSNTAIATPSRSSYGLFSANLFIIIFAVGILFLITKKISIFQ